MICIFCLKEKPTSVEHVFPEAIGGTLMIDRVCKECNDVLGAQVDAPLVDHALTIIRRSQLGITGKAGIAPDVFSKVFGEGRLANDPDSRVIAHFPQGATTPTIKLLYKRKMTQLADGKEVIQIAIDSQDIKQVETIIRRERKRAGMPPLTKGELNAEVDRAVKFGSAKIENPEVKYEVPIDLVEYQRGILKIVYELGWYWLGESYLADPMADKLRGLIFSENPITSNADTYRVRGSIMIGTDRPPLSLWKNMPSSHIGLAMRVGKQISVAVRIFDTFSAVVGISEDAPRYVEFGHDHEGKFIAIDPMTGTEREATLTEELGRILGHQ